jgi:hypothetical protein
VAGIIGVLDVVNINISIVILVNLIKSLLDNSLSVGVHWSSDGSNELVVLDETTLVIIEVVEESNNLVIRESEHVVSHSFLEFKFVEG